MAVEKTVNGYGETYAEIVKGKGKMKDVEQYWSEGKLNMNQ